MDESTGPSSLSDMAVLRDWFLGELLLRFTKDELLTQISSPIYRYHLAIVVIENQVVNAIRRMTENGECEGIDLGAFYQMFRKDFYPLRVKALKDRKLVENHIMYLMHRRKTREAQ